MAPSDTALLLNETTELERDCKVEVEEQHRRVEETYTWFSGRTTCRL